MQPFLFPKKSIFSLSPVYNKLLFPAVEAELPQVLQNIVSYQDYRALLEDL